MAPLSEKKLVWVALLSGMSIFAILLLIGLWQTDGVLVYSLDDPYIHLSMAEQIIAGGYGINPGEYASADSSILYPILLLPFVGTDFHTIMPLVLNALALMIALVLLAKITYNSDIVAKRGTNSIALFIVVFAPLALNFQGLALIGMEHMLQVATVLLAFFGLLRWLDSGKLNWLLITAILVGPLLRYESLGLSMLLAVVLFFWGHKKTGMILAFGACAPIVIFGFWLRSLGLSFLPNSVLAKAAIVESGENTLWALFTHNFNQFGSPYFASLFIVVSLILLSVSILPWFGFCRRSRVISFVAGSAGFGHAILGRFGWADRYEIYALTLLAVTCAVLIAPLSANKGRAASLAKIGMLVAFGVGFTQYFGATIVRAIYGPANVYNQQWQMAELARRFEFGPVLANDIGLLSFQNEKKIIDLYGLASKEALDARRNHEPRGWPNRIADREGAGMAMVYDEWLAPSLAEGWVPVAYLNLEVPYKFVLDRVTIYATRPETIAPVRALLISYGPQLPRYATLNIVDSIQEPPAEEGQ